MARHIFSRLLFLFFCFWSRHCGKQKRAAEIADGIVFAHNDLLSGKRCAVSLVLSRYIGGISSTLFTFATRVIALSAPARLFQRVILESGASLWLQMVVEVLQAFRDFVFFKLGFQAVVSNLSRDLFSPVVWWKFLVYFYAFRGA